MTIKGQPAATSTPGTAPADPAPATPAATPAVETPPAAPAAPPVEATPAPAPAPAATGEVEPKVLTIPSNSMKRIKQEERERGRSEALAQLDAEAASFGFSSYEEMKAYVQAQKSQPAAQPAPAQNAPAEDPVETAAQEASERESQALSALQQKHQQLLEEKRKLNRARAREERRNRELSRELQNMEATMELKLAAKDAGVSDVDYAVEVFRRTIKGMSEEDLKNVNESKFFSETLRQTHPHLFATEQRPVSTGTANTPPAKATGQPPAPSVNKDENGIVDAKKLDGQGFKELLRKRGLSDPSTGGMLA